MEQTESLVDLMKVKFSDPVWVVDTFLHRGATLLSGAAKSGKSYLSYQMAINVACGTQFLGRYQAHPGAVLYCDFENGRELTQSRFRQLTFGQHCLDNIYLRCGLPGGALFGEGGEDALGEILAERSYSMVVLDTMQACFPGVTAKDIVKAQYRQTKMLSNLAAKHKIALLALTHNRKGISASGVEAVGGTMSFAGGADSIITLFKSRKSSTLELSSRRSEDVTLSVRRATNGAWEIDDTLGGAVQTRPISAAREEILALLASQPLTPTQIAQKLHKDSAAIRQMVKRLKDQNVLQMFPDGSYGLLGNNDDDIPFAA